MESAARALYHKAAEQGRFYIDFVGYVNWLEFPQLVKDSGEPFNGGYHKHFRIGGVKVVADGSPQGKTAFWTKPLLTPVRAASRIGAVSPTSRPKNSMRS